MRQSLYIFLPILLVLLVSCQGLEPLPGGVGECELQLSLARVGVKPATRAVDDDLALTILDSQGGVFRQYSAGSVPSKITLSPGEFTIRAYTDNQQTWTRENEGRGAACFLGSCQVQMEPDHTTYAHLEVPMTNYAVSLALPEHFEFYFASHALTLQSGGRETSIRQGEKAYFDPADGGFAYQLSATNTDQVSHHTSPITYRSVGSGKNYRMTYYYGTEDTGGGIDIIITDDMQNEDIVPPSQ